MNNYYVYLDYLLIGEFYDHEYTIFVIMPAKSPILIDL